MVHPQPFGDLPVDHLVAAVSEMRNQHTLKVFPTAYAFLALPLVAVQRPCQCFKSTWRIARNVAQAGDRVLFADGK